MPDVSTPANVPRLLSCRGGPEEGNPESSGISALAELDDLLRNAPVMAQHGRDVVSSPHTIEYLTQRQHLAADQAE